MYTYFWVNLSFVFEVFSYCCCCCCCCVAVGSWGKMVVRRIKQLGDVRCVWNVHVWEGCYVGVHCTCVWNEEKILVNVRVCVCVCACVCVCVYESFIGLFLAKKIAKNVSTQICRKEEENEGEQRTIFLQLLKNCVFSWCYMLGVFTWTVGFLTMLRNLGVVHKWRHGLRGEGGSKILWRQY